MSRISTHLRRNIVGYVALFFALSAGAYAAGLQPDSVRSKHIKDGQVKTQDVADEGSAGALTGQDVANDSLDGWDIQNLSGADLQPNTLGADEVGPVVTRFGAIQIPAGEEQTVTASCLAGEELLGGGGGPAAVPSGPNQIYITDSQRSGTGNTWTLTALNATSQSAQVVAEANCLTK